MNRQPDVISLLIDFIVNHKGGALFHITDARNRLGIEQHGLLSREELHRRQLPYCSGGDAFTLSQDDRLGLSAYVFLGFHPNPIMPAHKTEGWRRPRVVYVKPDILYGSGVKLALGRANSSRTSVLGVRRGIYEMDRDVFAGNYDPNDIKANSARTAVYKYEVLVPTAVPRELLKFDW